MDALTLIAKIKMDLDEYEKGLDTAEKEANNFGSKLKTAAKVGTAAVAAVGTAAVAAGKMLYSNAQEVAVYGDNVDKMSQKIGISAKAYQEWDAVFQHSGANIGSLQAGMRTLNSQLNKVKDTATLAKSPFAQLGLSLEEVQAASKDPDKALETIISHLQQLPAGAERSALATQLLGRSGVELGALLNTSAEDTQKMRDRVHELGGVMSDEAVKAAAAFQDNMQDLRTAMDGVKRNITYETLPAFNALIDGFTKLIAGEDGAEEAIDKGVEAMGKAIDTIIPKVGKLLETLLPKVLEIGGKLVMAIAEQIPNIIVAVAKQIPKIVKDLLKAYQKIYPEVVKAGVLLIEELAGGMKNGTGDLINLLLEITETVFNTLIENAPRLIDAGLTLLMNLIDGIMDNLPKVVETAFTLVQRLFEGIMERLPEVIEKGAEILAHLIKGIVDNLPKIVQMAADLIKTLVKTLVDHLPDILQAGINLLLELGRGIFEALPDLLTQIPQIITDLIGALLSPEMIGKLLQAGLDMIGNIFDGILDGDFLGTAWDLITGLLEAVLAIPGTIMEIGAKVVNMIWEGMKSAWGAVQTWFEDRFEDIFGNLERAKKELNAELEKQASYREAIEKNSRKYHPEWYADEYASDSNHYSSQYTQEKNKRDAIDSGNSMAARYNTTNIYLSGSKSSQVYSEITAENNARGNGG